MGTVKDSATEALRNRRDPARIAERRRAAAKRRVAVWSIAAIVMLGAGTAGVAEIVNGEPSPSSIGAVVLVVGLLLYSVVNGVSAARDLAERNRVVRSLPPPQPARRAVTGSARRMLAQLDGYSDALRASVGMMGVESGAAEASVRELRNETLVAADAAEVRIRARGAELAALQRASSGALAPGIAETIAHLETEISSGVAEYGRLVTAASSVAAAYVQMASTAQVAPSAMSEATDRLIALAAGMREITALPQ